VENFVVRADLINFTSVTCDVYRLYKRVRAQVVHMFSSTKRRGITSTKCQSKNSSLCTHNRTLPYTQNRKSTIIIICFTTLQLTRKQAAKKKKLQPLL
jgi:hypothetical protein